MIKLLKILKDESTLEYTFWIFYSIQNNLPELYVQVVKTTKEGHSQVVKDFDVFINPQNLHLTSSDEKRPYFMTLKEHPVLSKTIVFYLH